MGRRNKVPNIQDAGGERMMISFSVEQIELRPEELK